MSVTGFEPARPFGHQIPSLACLPIPSHGAKLQRNIDLVQRLLFFYEFLTKPVNQIVGFHGDSNKGSCAVIIQF